VSTASHRKAGNSIHIFRLTIYARDDRLSQTKSPTLMGRHTHDQIISRPLLIARRRVGATV